MKVYDWALAIYPKAFRDRFAAGMRAAFAEDHARARRRGRFAAGVFLMTAILHVLWFAIVERLPRIATIRSFISADVRDAVRSLWGTPITTTVAVVSLALGIGANTALFSILNSLVIKELPVRHPEQIVIVGQTDLWTNPIWEQIRDRHSDLFDGACAWYFQQFDLSASGRMDPIGGAYVSGSLFGVLGVNTVVGRALTSADDVRGGGADGYAVVISHRLWQRRFGGAGDVLGRRITVNRVPFTVVGVAPASFQTLNVGQMMDVFVPLASEAAIRGPESTLDGRASWWLRVMARLKPGQSVEQATAAFNARLPAIRAATIPLEWPADYQASYLTEAVGLFPASTGVSDLRMLFEQPLTIIMMVVAAVLLIACANIANVMLARASARRHEMSVRLALGASRLRLAVQLLTESLLLATIGGVAGLIIARVVASLLVQQLGSEVTSVSLGLPIDWRVLGFTAAVCLGATVLFGLAPAFGLRGVEPNDALKEQSRGVTGDRRFGLRNALVVAQVALSFVLVMGAGLFVRTFASLTTTPLGFDASRLLIVSGESRVPPVSLVEGVAMEQRIADAASTVPGVTRASLSFLTPMSGRGWTHRVQVSNGRTISSRGEQTAFFNNVASGWFETYGMRILAGRDIAPSDVRGAEPVAVVNEAFVRRFVGQESPLGRRITTLGLGKLSPPLIVGVVNDAVYGTVRRGVVPTVYVPIAQGQSFGTSFSVTVKLGADRSSVERGLTAVLSQADPNLSFSFRDYGDQVRATLNQERLVALLSGFFGALALLLAALGLYGVTAYSVSRRRPELAVRLALGAGADGVVRLVLRRVAALLIVGGVIGVVLSVWAATFVGSLLFRVTPRDSLTFAATAVVLLVVGLFAGWLPARAASRLDATTALRG
jgi:putative ABC transport system permease protein